jgi:hypothetical protein
MGSNSSGANIFMFLVQIITTLWPTKPSIEWLAQFVSSGVQRQTGETTPDVRQ